MHLFTLYFYSFLFPLLKLVEELEKLAEQVENVECAYLKFIPVFSFGIRVLLTRVC